MSEKICPCPRCGEAFERVEDCREHLRECSDHRCGWCGRTRKAKVFDALLVENGRLRAALGNLYATVMGEFPALLDEDSGGAMGFGAHIEELLDASTEEAT